MSRTIFDVSSRRPAVRRWPALLLCGFVLPFGCTVDADEAIPVSLDQNFELRIGQSAYVDEVDLQLDFLEVLQDSRCAVGEQCITEGDAIIRIRIQVGGGQPVERELHTATRMPQAADHANLSVGLVVLNPRPVSGRMIGAEDYVATFRVVRGVSGGQLIY